MSVCLIVLLPQSEASFLGCLACYATCLPSTQELGGPEKLFAGRDMAHRRRQSSQPSHMHTGSPPHESPLSLSCTYFSSHFSFSSPSSASSSFLLIKQRHAFNENYFEMHHGKPTNSPGPLHAQLFIPDRMERVLFVPSLRHATAVFPHCSLIYPTYNVFAAVLFHCCHAMSL